VDSGQADALDLVINLDLDPAVFGYGQIELGYLITLGQVGVEVVLPGENVGLVDPAVGGQPHLAGIFHALAVQPRSHAGQAPAGRTGIGVGRLAEFGLTAAKDLGVGAHLGMNFQPDNGLKFHWLLRGFP